MSERMRLDAHKLVNVLSFTHGDDKDHHGNPY